MLLRVHVFAALNWEDGTIDLMRAVLVAVVGVSLFGVGLAIAAAAFLIRPVVVVRGGDNEGPVASGSWFAWMHGTTANPIPPISQTDVYVRHGSSRAWRANPAGTHAETGGISEGVLVIQLIKQGSALATVNLATHKLRLLARPFNMPHRFEWRPSLSGKWLLYGSIDYADQTYTIQLANLRTKKVIQLEHVQGHAAYAAPGQVNGPYATWISCPDNHCIAYRYDIDTDATIQMPPIGGAQYWHFGPSVTNTGTVYFGVAQGCASAQLIRWQHGQTRTIYRFSPGTAFLYSFATNTKPTTVYYDAVACAPHALSQINAIRDATR
jgi:hypothetical protein